MRNHDFQYLIGSLTLIDRCATASRSQEGNTVAQRVTVSRLWEGDSVAQPVTASKSSEGETCSLTCYCIQIIRKENI